MPPFKNRTILLNPNEPAIAEYSHLDLDHPYKCGFLKLSKCYNTVVDKYDLKDWSVWQDFVKAGFVLKVREGIGNEPK